MPASSTWAHLATASWVRVTAVAVMLLAACLLVVQHSTSSFSSTTGNTGNSLNTGSVVLTNNRPGGGLFAVPVMRPAQLVENCITVTYSGTNAATAVRLYGSSPTSALSPYLDLVVWRSATCGNTETPIFNSSAPAASAGTLQAFTTNHSSYNNGIDTGWTPTPGDTRAFIIRFTMKDDNAAQGKSATPAFTWEVRGA